jgi:hypothetical protein
MGLLYLFAFTFTTANLVTGRRRVVSVTLCGFAFGVGFELEAECATERSLAFWDSDKSLFQCQNLQTLD